MARGRPTVGIVAASLDIVGGQAVQAHELCLRLRADGWHVRFVPVNPRFPRPLAWLRALPYARTVLNQALYLPSLAALRACDVVHVFCASYASFLLAAAPALLAARAARKRVILNYHSGEAEDHLARWGALVHPWLRLAHEIVVPSEFLSRVFDRFGYRTRVIHNVVDLQRFQTRERATLRPSLLSNRNLEAHYRVDNTLRAFALLAGRHDGAQLTVAGDGREAHALRGLARALGAPNVCFAGRVAPDAMPAVYDQADVFVNSSVIDNQPLSILEAFAAGLPVVSTAPGDVGSMIKDGESGLLVPADDPDTMAEAVERLLARPDEAREMTRRARESLRRFSWPSVRNQWAQLYLAGSA